MLESIPVAVLVGVMLGFLAGMGIGGGSLLIMWLTLVVNIQQQDARAINLMFFLAASGSVSIFRWKKGNLNLPKLFPAMISGCASAALFSWIGLRTDLEILRTVFGVLLVITGVRELLYRPRKAK